MEGYYTVDEHDRLAGSVILVVHWSSPHRPDTESMLPVGP
jgi:hypothetical protein